jgi:hypothetical protein
MVSYRHFQMALMGLLKLVAPAVVALGFVAAATGGASAVPCGAPTSFTVTSNSAGTIQCGIDENSPGVQPDNVNGANKHPVGMTIPTTGLNNSADGINNVSENVGDSPLGTYVGLMLKVDVLTSHTGKYYITPPAGSLFTSLILVIVGGGGQNDPRWASFILPTDTTEGTWSIGGQNGFSHAVLYGMVAAVPVPAGIALGAAGLGMLGLLGWRRKKTLAA